MTDTDETDDTDTAVRIRKMREEEVPAAMEILDEYDMAPETDRDGAERSEIRVENSFVAADGDDIVGTASYIVHSDTLAETASMAVSSEYRGEGLGYRLQTARLEEMYSRGIETVRTETDRPETIEWYIEHFGYERVGTNPKKHDFSLPDVDEWTVLELDLEAWAERVDR
ncbi:GNAT family N-acetyltransferase [Haloglomus halophilum]|jgi:3-keto-5-aminohexanoate cleavage enzyme|uniref:GNAT family N-acetyltransferase n=1 Tax=Haloglomus halophilum TaxID=2962672 RepID=UPI0020C95D70|nr:GNAT family N-acetyltransferase [Haloglomus halophilum]